MSATVPRVIQQLALKLHRKNDVPQPLVALKLRQLRVQRAIEPPLEIVELHGATSSLEPIRMTAPRSVPAARPPPLDAAEAAAFARQTFEPIQVPSSLYQPGMRLTNCRPPRLAEDGRGRSFNPSITLADVRTVPWQSRKTSPVAGIRQSPPRANFDTIPSFELPCHGLEK